jgi:hypothetical protein
VPVVHIQKALTAIVGLGYAVLLARLLLSTGYLRLKFFTLYVAAMVPAYLAWNPNDAQSVVAWGILLIALRVCVAIEVYLIVAPELSLSERRGLLATIALIAGVPMLLCWGYYDQPGLMGWYKTIRQLAHVGLAAALLFGVLGLNIHPPRLERWQRRHALITTLYVLLYAAISFVRTGKGQGELWYTADAVFQAGAGLCIGLWLWFVVPKRSVSLFKARQPIL